MAESSTSLSISPVLTHLIFIMTLGGGTGSPHFTDEKTDKFSDLLKITKLVSGQVETLDSSIQLKSFTVDLKVSGYLFLARSEGRDGFCFCF